MKSKRVLTNGTVNGSPISDDLKKRIVELYANGLNMEQIQVELKVSLPTISKWLHRAGISVKTGRERRYKIDDSVFDDINEQSAYWAGMIMADGCIHSDRKVNFGLHEDDKGHLLLYRSFLKAENPIYLHSHIHEASGKEVRAWYMNFVSPKIVSRLADFGITPRKSKTACVADCLAMNRDFWRGVIDGDGTLGNYKASAFMSLVGSLRMCEQFRDYVLSVCPNCKMSIGISKSQRGCANRASVGATNAARVVKSLYYGCNVALERKHRIAREIIQRYADKI